MKKVAIVQSNYIPWKGYFDLIAGVDEFIIFDDVQYTKRDWRNRNLLKSQAGSQWLTIPVVSKGRYNQLISETEINGTNWASKHWRTICANYGNAPHFPHVTKLLEPYYEKPETMLSEQNIKLIRAVCDYLSIKSSLTLSTDYESSGNKTDRLLSLCLAAEADVYISGPSAKVYLQEEKFAAKGITVEWFDYAGYPEYPQLWNDFVHQVSIVDLLMNCGKSAPEFMKHGMSK